jgi:putative ABC transport system substrate-binding protein
MESKNKIISIFCIIITIFLSWYYYDTYKKDNNKIIIGIASWVKNKEFERNVAAFKASFARSGFISGKDILFIENIANGNKEKQKEIIEEYKKRKVDLIYSLTTSGTLIAKKLTKDIPIVFSIVTYPVEANVIKSHDNSENNLVGTRNYISLKDQLNNFITIVPRIKTIGFIHREGEPNSIIQFNKLKSAAKDKGINVIDIKAKSLNELELILPSYMGKIDSIYSACDTLVQSGGEEIIISFTLKNKLPDFTCNKSGVSKGSLVGTVADFAHIGSMSGNKAVKIIKDNVLPKELKTQWPKKGNILLNITKSDLLNIKIPKDILSNAKEVYR